MAHVFFSKTPTPSTELRNDLYLALALALFALLLPALIVTRISLLYAPKAAAIPLCSADTLELSEEARVQPKANKHKKRKGKRQGDKPRKASPQQPHSARDKTAEDGTSPLLGTASSGVVVEVAGSCGARSGSSGGHQLGALAPDGRGRLEVSCVSTPEVQPAVRAGTGKRGKRARSGMPSRPGRCLADGSAQSGSSKAELAVEMEGDGTSDLEAPWEVAGRKPAVRGPAQRRGKVEPAVEAGSHGTSDLEAHWEVAGCLEAAQSEAEVDVPNETKVVVQDEAEAAGSLAPVHVEEDFDFQDKMEVVIQGEADENDAKVTDGVEAVGGLEVAHVEGEVELREEEAKTLVQAEEEEGTSWEAQQSEGEVGAPHETTLVAEEVQIVEEEEKGAAESSGAGQIDETEEVIQAEEEASGGLEAERSEAEVNALYELETMVQDETEGNSQDEALEKRKAENQDETEEQDETEDQDETEGDIPDEAKLEAEDAGGFEATPQSSGPSYKRAVLLAHWQIRRRILQGPPGLEPPSGTAGPPPGLLPPWSPVGAQAAGEELDAPPGLEASCPPPR